MLSEHLKVLGHQQERHSLNLELNWTYDVIENADEIWRKFLTLNIWYLSLYQEVRDGQHESTAAENHPHWSQPPEVW